MKRIKLIEQLIDRAVEKEEGVHGGYAVYRRNGEEVYTCFVYGRDIVLTHYGTLIFSYDADTEVISTGGAYSVSDRDAINTATHYWQSRMSYQRIDVNIVQGDLQMTAYV